MLTHLVIRNFAIIEHLEIPFRAGFTVLTGETGAGKSIIIDALNLILGGRATSEVIRTDADEAVVEAIFEPRPETLARINERLDEQGMPTDDHQLVIRRIVARSGRNKVFVNSSLTTASALGDMTRGLVDISGQHEHYSLLRTDGHIDILDGFAGLTAERQAMQEVWSRFHEAQRQLKALRENVRERLHRIDFLRFQVEEIDAARLKPGEEESIQQELDRLKNAEKIGDAVRRTRQLTYEGEGSAAEQLSEAVALLQKVAPFDPRLEVLAQRVEEARILTEEVSRELVHAADDLDMDPARINTLIERSEAIRKLRRKHGADVEGMLQMAEAMRKELDTLENAEEHVQKLEDTASKARKQAMQVALDLGQKRRAAARRVEERIERELSDLHMARTRFVTQFQPAELPTGDEAEGRLSALGLDTVEFMIAPNLGEAPKPMSKIASGGELSRIMLAIKAVLMERDTIDTYIFDEVDTGISGSTADMVGIKIERTADEHQVLCITHLAQIASRSHHHYMVEKLVIEGRTQSTIRPLGAEERIEEIARMLGGARVTSTTRDAARELLGTRL